MGDLFSDRLELNGVTVCAGALDRPAQEEMVKDYTNHFLDTLSYPFT